MSKIDEYRELVKSVRSSIGYWKSYSLLQFTVSLTRIMRMDKVSGRNLASRLGLSAAQVSKVLSGNENITVETMARFADALDSVVHIHVAKRGVQVQWNELSADSANLFPVAAQAGAGTTATIHAAGEAEECKCSSSAEDRENGASRARPLGARGTRA
jgi:transcriptional regulator with XRE-family HTH domain